MNTGSISSRNYERTTPPRPANGTDFSAAAAETTTVSIIPERQVTDGSSSALVFRDCFEIPGSSRNEVRQNHLLPLATPFF